MIYVFYQKVYTPRGNTLVIQSLILLWFYKYNHPINSSQHPLFLKYVKFLRTLISAFGNLNRILIFVVLKCKFITYCFIVCNGFSLNNYFKYFTIKERINHGSKKRKTMASRK